MCRDFQTAEFVSGVVTVSWVRPSEARCWFTSCTTCVARSWRNVPQSAPGVQSPTAAHWLGTDAFGRDVASLLLVGARASILVGVIAVGIGLVVGTALGLLAAARRGCRARRPNWRCC